MMRLPAYLHQPRYWWGVVAFALINLGLAKFGLWIAPFVHGNVSAIWPASGASIAVLVLFGRRYWPGIFVGELLANVGALSLPVASIFGVGDSLAALLAWSLLNSYKAFRPQLDNISDVVKLTFLAAPADALLAASIGVVALIVSGDMPSANGYSALGVWWLGDMVGNLVVAPAIMLFYACYAARPTREQITETMLLLALMMLVVVLPHLQWYGLHNFDPQFHLLFPFVVWAALRLGGFGVAMTVLTSASIAVALTLGEARWLGMAIAYTEVAHLQTVLVIISVPGFLIAAALAEHSHAEQRYLDIAYHDGLTGLFNRNSLLTQLEKMAGVTQRNGHDIALLFMDLDRFKNINDTLGHDMGDLVLQEFAQRIKKSVRNEDFVARLGGDEFTVLISGLQARDAAAAIAQKILDTMRAPVNLHGHEYVVSGSIGIAVLNATVTQQLSKSSRTNVAQELMRQADTAMYRAKRNNAGFMFFNSSMDINAKLQLRLENALRLALSLGQFELYYQPKVSTNSERIVGCEALIRWRHPTKGLVEPDKFIGVLESIGLILPVGAWALREACEQMQRWREQGLFVQRVAVNLSMRQFLQPDLLLMIDKVLDDTKIPAHLLELEITESVAMSNAQLTVDTLTALKQRGIYISIDDFGTGYSSLSYLKRFPIDAVKIDRSFTQDLEHDGDDAAAIVTATIRLAHAMNLSVVAEGVENYQQRDFLLKYGCDVLQGYYYSRPVPADEYAIMLARGYCHVG
jgi:diguanylate cyclase (GGDEF)-like protein